MRRPMAVAGGADPPRVLSGLFDPAMMTSCDLRWKWLVTGMRSSPVERKSISSSELSRYGLKSLETQVDYFCWSCGGTSCRLATMSGRTGPTGSAAMQVPWGQHVVDFDGHSPSRNFCHSRSHSSRQLMSSFELAPWPVLQVFLTGL
jgi:hypothetical protein